MKVSVSRLLAIFAVFPLFGLAHTPSDEPVKGRKTVFTEELRRHILDDFLASSDGKRLRQPAPKHVPSPALAHPMRIAAGSQMSSASLLRMATLAQITPYVMPTGNGTLMAASFAPFKPKVRFYWDGSTFYEESDNLPDGIPNRMSGITSWQQQIPLPVAYFANTPNPEGTTTSLGFGQPNYWRLPLVPTPAATPTLIFTPGSSSNNFQRGAIALASNGVAIFNPANNTGRVSYEIGELDYYGGHCGLADDYHYHIIPMHLSSRFGGPLSDDKAVAWGLDGYPIYGYVEPDGTTRQALDTNGGHNHGGWGYHYHAVGNNTVDATHPYGTPQSPYTMTSFYGTVVNLGGQVDGQPEVGSIRQDGTGGYNAKPIGGASIVAMMNPAPLVVDGSGNLGLPTTSINLTGCATTFQSTTVTCASTSGLVTGMAIVGAGVTNNATLTSITSGTQFVISLPAIATTTAQSFTAVPMTGATNDQYVMRVNMSGTNYDECWKINRNVNPRTLTVTWRAQALISGNLSGPVVTTTNTYIPSTGTAGTGGTAASNRLAAYTVAGWSEVKLPDTSQTQDSTTTFGEDADYTINAQSFTDNADGTVTDNVTGLMWQKVDNGESTWETAVANAATVTIGGYTDWRLPTPAELFSIFNHQNLNPALDTTYFPNNPAGTADYWWTSDIYGNSTTNVWCSNAGGGLGGKPKSETLSYTPPGIYRYSARYVRGAKPSNLHSYVNNLDGTVTDTDTGLMWTQVPAAATAWDAALSYAENLSLNGYTDWRLPNIKELQTLTDYTLTTATSTTNIKASINRTVFAKTLTNCTTTSGSTLVTCADTTGLLPGMPIVDATDVASAYISNTTVPTVSSVTSGTTFVMSSAATGSGSLLTLKALAPPTAYWSSTSLRGDTTKAWLVETGINSTVLAANGPTRNSQGIISYEAKTSSYPIFVVRTTSVTTQISVQQPSGNALTDGVSTVSYGNVNVGSTLTKTFTISNAGSTSLTITGVTIDGTSAANFAVTAAPATTIAAGGSTTMDVQFNASTAGTKVAAIHTASSDTSVGAAFDITLSGTGYIPPPTVASVATSPTTPTNTDSPFVTATVTPSTGVSISSVQLQYNTGAQTTGTVFDETMTTIPLANPWSGSGSGALNAWTVTALNGGTVAQATGAANHTTPIALTSCTTTNGGTSVSCVSTTGLWPGMILYGPNVPAGAAVSSVTNTTTFVMSAAATGAGSALTLYAGGITLTNCSTTSASATVTCGSTVGLVAAVTQSLTGGSTTNGSGSVTVASTASLQPGMNVSGTGIPNGATISSITNSTQFVMNPPANATNTAQTYTASFSGMGVTGTGIPNNATITSITNSTQFVISANATATGSGVTLTAGGCGLQLSKGSASYTDTMVATTNAIPAAGTAGTLQFWVQTQNLLAGNGWTMQLSPDGGTTWNTRASESYSSTVNLANCALTSGSPNVACTSTAGLAAGMALTGQSLSLTGCSTTSGNTNITCASTTGLVAGMVVFGTGIPNNATVSSITNGTQFVLSANATATNSAQTFTALATVVLTSCATTATSTTVTCADTSKLVVGMVVTGPGIPINDTVASITNSTTFLLSTAASQTATNQNFTASYLPSPVTVLSVTDTTHFVLSANATLTASAVPLAATTVNHGFTQFTYSLAASELVSTLKLRFQFSGYNPPAPTRAPLVNIDDISIASTVGSAPVTLAMTSTGNGVYSVQLPLETTGTTVNYTITATDSNAGTTTSNGSYTVVTAAPMLAVTPSTAFSASGAAGSGTFTPASLSYTLTNSGTGTLSWTAGKTAAWLNLSGTSGTLAAGANTTVTVAINTASANSLSAATYSDTITFTNSTNGSGSTTRAASLLITNGTPTVPAAPTLTLPAYSASASQWMTWPAVATATSYTVQIASSANFTTSLLSSQTVTSPSASFTNLTSGVTYYYRVLATNSVGSSAYSSTVSSTQDEVAPTVTISTPATGGSSAASTIVVTGASSDLMSGVSGVKVNNVAATSSNNFATWTATVPLGFGTNAIIATATDGAGNLANSSAVTVTLTTAQTYNPLIIPAAMNGTLFNLNLNQTNKQFQTFSSTNPTLGVNPSTTLGPSPGTTTLGYNGALMWGPTLILNQGDTVQLNVSNHLDLSSSTLLRSTTTTVHWHGFHIPAIMDGGPRQVVAGGSTWSPTFTVKNNAATYWYHPHLHMATQEQMTLGAGGFIIVRDPQEAALALPRTYGVDDIPLAVTTRRFLAATNEFSANQYVQADGSTSSTDNYGDYVLVNGTMNPQVSLPKQFVRLRILNADIQRGYRFGFSDNRNFYVIANDQGLLNAPVQVSQVTMMIGERVEILVDLSQDAVGNSIDLKAYDNLGTAGGPGGAFFGFGGSESNTRTPNGTSGPENGGLLCNSDFIVLHINVAAATSGAITAVPATLASNTYWTNANVTNTRTVSITGGNGGTPGFSFNNIAYSPTVNNFTIPLNAVEKWVIQAGGVFGHSLHIHDIKFNIIARNLQTGGNSAQIFNTVGGVATSSNGLPASYESGWKDTVYVPKGETVTVIAKYDDFASPNNPYMFHCHMLNHEDGGLMGQFVVTSAATETIAAASATLTGSSNNVSFNFNATTGSSFLVQYSPDMTAGSWITVGVATSDGTSATYAETDTTRLGLAKGFYRAVIQAVVAPPVITSSATASGTHGAAFSYQITATNTPTGYSAILQSGNTGVPGGLSVNPKTGLISGTPTTAGTYNIEVSASNSGGTTRQTVVLTVN